MMRGRRGSLIEATWSALASEAETDGGTGPPVGFDPGTVDELPDPARRFLLRALPAGTPLHSAVELVMEGRIRLGRRWFPFRAEQILRAGVGFVWAPVVGGRIIRFTGADLLGPDGARTEFRLHGWIPVVRADGPTVARSAAGRLAAETVAWLPQALTPQAGAAWTAIDDDRAEVGVDAAGEAVPVEVTVDGDGTILALALERWNDANGPPGPAPFGGSVGGLHVTRDGVAIAGSGVVGWDWGTPNEADGVFFVYHITSARFPGSTPRVRR